MQKKMIVLVAGSSGAGKTTIIKNAIQRLGQDNLDTFPTCTTRTPREGEQHGRDYLFFDKPEFNQSIKEHNIIEAKRVYNNYYGTNIAVILEKLQSTKVLIKDFDVQGYQNVKKRISRSLEKRNLEQIPMITVLIDAPDDILLARLTGRNDNTNVAERATALSVDRACKDQNEYDYRIDNSSTNMNYCLDKLCEIIDKEYQAHFHEPLCLATTSELDFDCTSVDSSVSACSQKE